jgi:hypothetical protein
MNGEVEQGIERFGGVLEGRPRPTPGCRVIEEEEEEEEEEGGGGERRPVRGADNITTFMCRLCLKVWDSQRPGTLGASPGL